MSSEKYYLFFQPLTLTDAMHRVFTSTIQPFTNSLSSSLGGDFQHGPVKFIGFQQVFQIKM